MDLDELGIAEFNEIKQKLECNDQKIERLLEKTKLKYPQIESDKGALYLLAKDRNINFDYDNKGNLIGSRVDSNNFEVDVQNFLDRDI